jgi:hypothetical protein
MTNSPALATGLGAEIDQQLARLLSLRESLLDERQRALSPAIDHALRLSAIYLDLAIGYCGHAEDLFPEEVWSRRAAVSAAAAVSTSGSTGPDEPDEKVRE